jgi:hypothetical protein
MAMRLAASSMMMIKKSLWVDSLFTHVRVALGIWAQRESAETVSDMS